MQNILLIGNGAREHAIAEAIMRSGQQPRLFACMKANNPGIATLSEKIFMSSYSDLHAIVAFATALRIDFAVIGPEDPLNTWRGRCPEESGDSFCGTITESGPAGNLQILHP